MNIRSRTGGVMAAALLTACTAVVAAPTAAHAASYYCNGNVIAAYDNSHMSVHLIQSYDGSQTCVNTWIHSGGQQDTAAYLLPEPNHTQPVAEQAGLIRNEGGTVDHGNYWSWASTGWLPDGCYWWGGWVGSDFHSMPAQCTFQASPASHRSSLPRAVRITNVHSGLCMSVRDASFADGAIVDQWTCGNYPDQAWYIEASNQHPGYDFIVNTRSSKCLSVVNGSIAIGAKIDQWDCGYNYPDQLWYMPGSNPTTGAVVNYNSNACLSVPDASTALGVQLDQWPCNVGVYLDQSWTMSWF